MPYDLSSSNTYTSQLSIYCDASGSHLVLDKLCIDSDFLPVFKKRIKNKQGKELLLKATKIQSYKTPPCIFDATAGLGYDSLLFASEGARVISFERNPYIAFMTASSLMMARQSSELNEVTSRISFICGDFVSYMKNANLCPRELESDFHINISFLKDEDPCILPTPDILYLDPMFPASKKNAAAKKKLQLIQQLEEPCDDENALFSAALSCSPSKIIIKRPLKGPYFADKKPHYSLKGTSIRFDCFSITAKKA